MRVIEAAARLECSAGYVRRLCRTGELTALRLGSDWRISEDALADYIARNTTTATGRAATSPDARPASLRVVEMDGALPERWWESTATTAASPAVGRSRSAGKKKAAVSAN